MFENLTLWAFLKNISYIAIFTVSIEWLGFNPLSLTIFAVLMFVDVITGIARSIRLEGGNSFTSSTLKRGVISKLLLLAALMSFALTAKGMGYQIDTLAQGAVNVLSLGELYSILGNVHSARTGKVKHEFDAVTFLLARVNEVLKNVLK
jgi:hypothetical protein